MAKGDTPNAAAGANFQQPYLGMMKQAGQAGMMNPQMGGTGQGSFNPGPMNTFGRQMQMPIGQGAISENGPGTGFGAPGFQQMGMGIGPSQNSYMQMLARIAPMLQMMGMNNRPNIFQGMQPQRMLPPAQTAQQGTAPSQGTMNTMQNRYSRGDNSNEQV